MANPVLFNATDLESIAGVYITKRDPFKQPKRTLLQTELARGDGAVMLGTRWGAKEIPVEGYIQAATRDLFEQARDNLLGVLQAKEADLDIPVGGVTRRWTATMEAFILTESDLGAYGAFSIRFIASHPYGYETSNTTVPSLTGAITASGTIKSPTFLGNTEQAPVLTLTLTTVTGGTGASLTVENVATGQAVTINRDWVAGEVLTIDTLLEECRVGGVLVDANGAFPKWKGASQIRVTDTFTGRSITMTGVYKKRNV